MTAPKSTSFARVMANKSNGPAEDVVTVCFDRGDLLRQYGELAEELADLRTGELTAEAERTDSGEPSKSQRLAGKKRTSRAVADEMKALVDANSESFYDVRLRASTAAAWSALRAEHPPQEGFDDDEIGVHWEAFVPAAVRASLLDPEPTDEVWAYFEDSLVSGEWKRLGLRLWQLNEGYRERPFSALATSILSGNVGD